MLGSKFKSKSSGKNWHVSTIASIIFQKTGDRVMQNQVRRLLEHMLVEENMDNRPRTLSKAIKFASEKMCASNNIGFKLVKSRPESFDHLLQELKKGLRGKERDKALESFASAVDRTTIHIHINLAQGNLAAEWKRYKHGK